MSRLQRLYGMSTFRQIGVSFAIGGVILLGLAQQQTMVLDRACQAPLEECWQQYQLYSFLRLVGSGVGTLGLVIAAVPRSGSSMVTSSTQQEPTATTSPSSQNQGDGANSSTPSTKMKHRCMMCSSKLHSSHSYCYQCGSDTWWSMPSSHDGSLSTNETYEHTETFCGVCGVPVHDTYAYCANCGSRLTQMLRSQEPVYPRPKNPPAMNVVPAGVCTGCGARNRGANSECHQCETAFDTDVKNSPLLEGPY